jgi:hypothetical protein
MEPATQRRAESLKTFCASFGFSCDLGFRAAKDGRLKTIRFGKRLFVPASEIERVSREVLGPSSVVSCANRKRTTTQ